MISLRYTSSTEDYGLGTAYERQAIYALLERWVGAPRSLVEGPVDGFAGLGGLHGLGCAARGTQVTVVLPSESALTAVREVYRRAGLARQLSTVCADELPADRWEVVLAFNALPLARDWRGRLAELVSRASRHVVLCVTHSGSYGARLRRVLRRLERSERRAELFDHESTDWRALEPELRKAGRIDARAWLDCPWWPDLFVEPGRGLLDATLERLTSRPPSRPSSRFRYGPETFPWVGGRPPAELRRALCLHPTFDGCPALGPVFAHHRAYRIAPAARARDE